MNARLTIHLYRAGKCFGPGIAELLERVQRHRSLRAAAQSMDMAYSKAWTVVKNCEKSLGWKLLTCSTGGKNGGGATLTPRAAELLHAYHSYCDAVRQQADAMFDDYFGPHQEP